MRDPTSPLIKCLKSVFDFEEMRNGKYICPEIQQLKEATERYDPTRGESFITLLKALDATIFYMGRWKVNSESLKKTIIKMAKMHELPPNALNTSPTFKFSSLNHSPDNDFMSWISLHTGKASSKLDSNELAQTLIALLHYENVHGFCQRLNSHLEKNPDFLFNLIMESVENFINISHSRLILHLTDQQLATAIIKHTPSLVDTQKGPYEQVELLVDKLNEILSNGRSVSTLLRNAEAKPILDNSIFFEIYQSEEYQNKEASSLSLWMEAGDLKPGFQ
ncbi:MAG TPA: hypothetical protein PK657_11825 [Legionella sp.]|nr:hypothetical protein [Legionella sp.]